MYVKSDLYKYESAMAAYSLYSGKLKSVHDLLYCLISEHGTTKYLIIQDISSTTVCMCLKSPVASIYDLPGVVKSFFHAFATARLKAELFLSPGQQSESHCQMICWIQLLTLYIFVLT